MSDVWEISCTSLQGAERLGRDSSGERTLRDGGGGQRTEEERKEDGGGERVAIDLTNRS